MPSNDAASLPRREGSIDQFQRVIANEEIERLMRLGENFARSLAMRERHDPETYRQFLYDEMRFHHAASWLRAARTTTLEGASNV